MRIGVDIGGTFTDVAVVDADEGRIAVVKTSTTPRDIAAGVITALETAMSRHAIVSDDVALLSHATTVVTNALLEQKGARIALIASCGSDIHFGSRRGLQLHVRGCAGGLCGPGQVGGRVGPL